MRTQAEKAAQFRALHGQSGAFVIANAWDAGSAKLLGALGFKAVATTSAGLAFMLGRPDGEAAVERRDAMDNARAIARAVDLPVSIDLENGYGDAPQAVADTIAFSALTGAVGGSIEDATGRRDKPLYELDHAVERMRAARKAADASGIPYTLTGRAECFLVGHPDPLRESIKRLVAYAEAGADCLYAPGVSDSEMIRTLVREVPRPVNLLMTGAVRLTFKEIEALGVRRISVGGALARAAYSEALRCAREIAQNGQFGALARALPNKKLNEFFAGRGPIDG